MPRRYGRSATLCLLLLVGLAGMARATPITLDRSFAGNVNFVSTAATFRTQPDTGNSCALSGAPVAATLSGIPAGSTIRGAFLYWGGSGPTPDNTVTLDGVSTSADRQFTETFNQAGFNLEYFGGVADVTSEVSFKGNGSYSVGGLTVTNTDLGPGQTYCSSQAVVAGWGLLVVYENPAEDFRVVNVFDGLQFFRGNSITLTPSNFRVPNSPVNGKQAVLTWEGDVANSAPLNGFNENLIFNGTALTGPLNPINNQFNSTVNTLPSTTTYGVDLDTYDIDALISPGDTSASTTYSSGGDLVLLAMEAISVTNTPTSDLSITKSVSQALTDGGNGQYQMRVGNNGPLQEPGPIVVTDTLDSRLTYDGFSGSGWSCSASGQTVTCTHPGPLNDGALLPALQIDVDVQAGTDGQLIPNTASVSGQNFDNVSANSSDSTNTPVITGPGSPPIAVGSCETFDGGGLNNWSIAGAGEAGTSAQTANSAPDSMFLSEGQVTVTSNPINAGGGLLFLEMWIRRGDDGFSENPEAGENLVVEYLNSSNNWVTLETFNGGGTQGQIFTRQYSMPAGAAHSGLRVRYTLTGGSGNNFDFWHVDDLCLVGPPSLSVTKMASSTSVNPGGTVNYSIQVQNLGTGPATDIDVTDDFGEYLMLGLDTYGAGQAFQLVDGPPASGLSLGTISYSDNGGSTFGYSPNSGNGNAPAGFDGLVTDFIVEINGSLPAGRGFTLNYRAAVR
jgi:hypothetical protein